MLNRRRALASSLAATIVPSSVFGREGSPGPSDTIRLGVIGCGVRGKYLIGNLPPQARVVALCDASAAQIDSVRKPEKPFRQVLGRFADADAPKARIYQDYRQLIEHAGVDAVMIATPDHHHVQAALLACAGGLDVYCEKPLSLTIAEGRVLAAAVRKHDRILQVGSQQRSMQVNRFACHWVRDGGLGKLHRVRLRNYPGPAPLSVSLTRSIPASMDWDLFCGPAPIAPYHQDVWMKDAYIRDNRQWRGWDLFQPFSGHLMTNWGGHAVDMVLMALGDRLNGRVKIEPLMDQLDKSLRTDWLHKTPPEMPGVDAQVSLMRYCPVRLQLADQTEIVLDPSADATIFHGPKGQMRVSRNRYVATPADIVKPMDPAEVTKWKGAGHVARPHIENWIECMHSRTDPVAPVEVGHLTATICHLVNLARQLARPLEWDFDTEAFVNDRAANQLVDRPRRSGFEYPV